MLKLLDQIPNMDDNHKMVLEPYIISAFGSAELADELADSYRLEEWPPAVAIEEILHDRKALLLKFTQSFKLRPLTKAEIEAKNSAEGNSKKTV